MQLAGHLRGRALLDDSSKNTFVKRIQALRGRLDQGNKEGNGSLGLLTHHSE